MRLLPISIFLTLISCSVGQILVNLSQPQNVVFDYIIVGGGSGGATVAARLSENPSFNVLIIEAGGYPELLSYVPGLLLQLRNGSAAWLYPIEPQTACCTSFLGQRFNYVQGKVLGGTSSIDGMFYVRGNRYNFDSWAELGLTDWSYDKVLPYFLRSEGNTDPELMPTYHNSSGSLTVSNSRDQASSLNNFIQGAQLHGLPLTDYNGANQTGVSPLQFTIRNGTRCSTYAAFIDTGPVKKNLYLATYSIVTKIIIEKSTAVGVQVLINGQLIAVNASKEVILSAGSLASPKILMHSGIGPKEQLQKYKIPVVVDLPGVGENLQDHIGFTSLIWKVNCSKCVFDLLGAYSLSNMFNYAFFQQGPFATTPGDEGVAFTSTNQSNPAPNLQLVYSSFTSSSSAIDQAIFYGMNLTVLNQYYEPFNNLSTTFAIVPIMIQPKSRGYVRLNSSDPTAYPIVNFNFLADQRDADVLIAGAKLAKSIGDSEAFKSIGAEFIPTAYPGCESFQLYSDEYWNCTVRGMNLLVYRPVGTCKMGLSTDPMAVVDSQLRVFGVKNLRLVDASVMPIITSGNTNAPTIMIAEKAAELIMNLTNSNG